MLSYYTVCVGKRCALTIARYQQQTVHFVNIFLTRACQYYDPNSLEACLSVVCLVLHLNRFRPCSHANTFFHGMMVTDGTTGYVSAPRRPPV